ncbi:hypothetical protein CCAX7_004590 [Capsulimonas corticalis]|uniref:Uncharacterized protein n=1 Tax=Capsulimonas corticalis TaxID=2219043 RepID=A0A402D2Z4_9BACT|nr:DUF6157 family protein [Capsulimonas corticalis]BDI28408.1 hypothetical protein CCAX7_004590 [Capsulimonas corticalis]
MNYYSAFIHIATDSTAVAAKIPASKGEAKTIPALEYELLTERPYFYTQEELLFEVHLRRSSVSEEERRARRDALWAEFFSRPHACLRASGLAKTHGWGIHFDGEGKIGLVAVESPEYERYAGSPNLQQVPAMRGKRLK